MDQPKLKTHHVTEHLANERTVLAWVRTSIAVMTFGVALNRFSLFLLEFHRTSASEQAVNRHAETVGIALIALGVLIMLGASWHYVHVSQTIDEETYRPRRFMVIGMAFAVVAIGGTALVLLFSS
ncbi:YidH family protein [Reyranella sp.]|uniref:YidH family protein n=1 Tax=Reyranella sp. TaxID=1929291 RepID=UPI003D0E225C